MGGSPAFELPKLSRGTASIDTFVQ